MQRNSMQRNSMNSPVSIAKHGDIAVITIDNPPVNALSQAVRQGIADCLDGLENDTEVKAVVVACAGRTFVAGADISEFGKPPQEPHLPNVLRKLDQYHKPVIAALFGTALGGGLELALSCHYRVALKGTKVGLPEVNLGLIPGAGGTQLLPRIAGVATALEMITSGKPVAVEKVVEQGVVDQLVEGDLLQCALDYARTLLEQGKGPRPVSAIKLVKSADHDQLFSQWRARLEKRARGQIAPQHCVTSIENAVLLPFAEGLQKEREMFLACRSSPQSRAMRHAFFAERAAPKLTGLSSQVNALEVRRAGVIGAGTMGGAIAMCFAGAGIPVTLLETNEENLQRGIEAVRSQYRRSVERGRISEQQLTDYMGHIHGSCDYQDLADADLVVEAAFENMEVKAQIFSRLDQVCKVETVLASNTSYLDINQIAQSTGRPDRVLGMHFFSPANIMKLLEVVRADATDEQSLLTAMAVAKRIGKIAVAVGVCYGFVGNRMYSCYGREAQMLLLEGATPRQIDTAMESWGMAMGPLAVNDLSGIDIAYKARRENPNLPDDPCYFKPADTMVEAGRLGRKTAAGFYRYTPDGGEKTDAPEAIGLIRAAAAKLAVAQRDDIDDEEIQQRLIYALINEGARILEEGIAARAGDIDVIWLNGYGFPRFRGGPMCYADEVGLGNVLATIKRFREQLGARYWEPSPLLERLCQEGKPLAAFAVKNG